MPEQQPGPFSNIKIANNGTFTLDNTNGQWDELDKIFSAKKVFNVQFSGTTDIDDFSFTLSVQINSTITAKSVRIQITAWYYD